MIEIVVTQKKKIKEATDRLSQTLEDSKVDNELELKKNSIVEIRKIIHEIISELSIIGGFCDGWSRNYVSRISSAVAETVSQCELMIWDALILELFATMVNSIIIDFNKTPFRFAGEIKARLREFEAKLKATVIRK